MALHRRRRQQDTDEGAGPDSSVGRSGEADDSRLQKLEGKDTHDVSICAKDKHATIKDTISPKQSFHVTKYVILRLTGFVYFIAFLGAYYQNIGLMGSNGLVPAKNHMEQLQQNFSSPIKGFLSHPTLYWFIGTTLEDWHMEATAVIGITLSFLVMIGLDSFIIMVCLWLLDFSIFTVSGNNSFYAYGWESQLLETGFLAIWLCDIPSFSSGYIFRDAPSSSEPSLIVLWLFRWLCARISIGAGLIKLRGGKCWQEKTCLYYHFETQPIPSPMSFLFHFLPKQMLRRAVDLDFFVQLYSIWLVLLPGFNWYMKNLRRLGGFIQVSNICVKYLKKYIVLYCILTLISIQAGFMINIMLSGNFAFLNHVTIIPALACLDDACFPSWLINYVYQSRKVKTLGDVESRTRRSKIVRLFIDVCLLSLIGMLSIPVITNLLQIDGNRQAMNASFSSFRLVNTYGAFGSVGEVRYEPIISVSSDGKSWTEVELPCKPGDVKRRPCFCAPYHYRLDWNIWFIGFKPHQSMLQRRESWMYELLHKMLDNSTNRNKRPWLSLLHPSSATYLEQNTIQYAKVDMYRYKMNEALWSVISNWIRGDDVIWWGREFEEVLIRPLRMQANGVLAYANMYELQG